VQEAPPPEKAIVAILDTCSRNYGWTFEYVLSLTLFQVNMIIDTILSRESYERRINVDSIRVASHGDKGAYEKFVNALEYRPPSKSRKVARVDELPEGLEFG
jgi:hypothetical protein